MAIDVYQIWRDLDGALARAGWHTVQPSQVRGGGPDAQLVMHLSRENLTAMSLQLGSVMDSSLGVGLKVRRSVDNATGGCIVLPVPQVIWLLDALGVHAISDAA